MQLSKFLKRKHQSHVDAQPVQVYDPRMNLLRFEVVSILGGAPAVLQDDGIGKSGVSNVRRQQAERDLAARVELDDGRMVPVFYVRERLQDWTLAGEKPVRMPALPFPVLGDAERAVIEEYKAVMAERYAKAPARDTGVDGAESPKAKKIAGGGARVGA